MKDQINVTILVNGTVKHFDVTKRTTCDDVIKMATRKITVTEDSKCFGIFESLFGVQKMLLGHTKLLKHVRSWGSNTHAFNLEIKEVNVTKTKMVSLSRARTKLKRLRNMIWNHEVKSSRKYGTDLHDNLQFNIEDEKQNLHDKNITILGEVLESRRQESQGKKELLNRYLNDSMDLSISNDSFYNVNSLPDRTRGVGCEDNTINEFGPHGRGNDDDADYTIDSELVAEDHELNQGFVACDRSFDDETFVIRDDLNDCFIYDFDETNFTSESMFQEDSDYESIDELERNVIEDDAETTHTKLNDIKRILSNGDINARVTGDDILDSFMCTFVNGDDSDEGLSSVGSELY